MIVFDPLAEPIEGVQHPARLGVESENFLAIWGDEAGLHITWAGPGPWDEVRRQLGSELRIGETVLAWSRPFEPEPPPAAGEIEVD